MFYSVTILLHSEFEHGTNPIFLFDTKKEMQDFTDICFANDYTVEIKEIKELKEV